MWMHAVMARDSIYDTASAIQSLPQ